MIEETPQAHEHVAMDFESADWLGDELRAMPLEAAPPGFRDGVLARIDAEESRTRRRFTQVAVLVPAAIMACLAVSFLVPPPASWPRAFQTLEAPAILRPLGEAWHMLLSSLTPLAAPLEPFGTTVMLPDWPALGAWNAASIAVIAGLFALANVGLAAWSRAEPRRTPRGLA